ERGDRVGDLAHALPFVRGDAVQTANAVEDGAADFVLGVGAQRRAVRRVVVVNRSDQTDDAGRDQVLDVDIRGQLLLDSRGDPVHLGQVLEDQALTVLGGQRTYGIGGHFAPDSFTL